MTNIEFKESATSTWTVNGGHRVTADRGPGWRQVSLTLLGGQAQEVSVEAAYALGQALQNAAIACGFQVQRGGPVKERNIGSGIFECTDVED